MVSKTPCRRRWIVTTSAKKLAWVLCVLCVWDTWRTELQSRIRTPRRADVADLPLFQPWILTPPGHRPLRPVHSDSVWCPATGSWQRLVPCRHVLIASGAQGCRPGDPWSPLRNSHVVWYCLLASWRQISLPRSQGFFHQATSRPDISALWSCVRISRSWSIISVTCIHVPVTVYGSGVQDFLCLVWLLCLLCLLWLFYSPKAILGPGSLC